MREYTDAELIARVESHARGFEGWKDGYYDIMVRSRADAYDQFDDMFYTFLVTGGVPKFLMKRAGTTNAGSYGLMNFRVYNSRGCAVLQSDRIVYGSHAFGYHHGKMNNPCYRQVKGFAYYRDGNRNQRAEEIGPVFWDIIGANVHRARGFARLIKNWSVACLVTQAEADYNAWLRILINAGKPRLNVCILMEFDPDEKTPAVSEEASTSAMARQDNGTLRPGDKGKAVQILQKKLIELKLLGAGADDGIYGKVTEGAVRAFQRKAGLDADGIAGEKTLKALGL